MGTSRKSLPREQNFLRSLLSQSGDTLERIKGSTPSLGPAGIPGLTGISRAGNSQEPMPGLAAPGWIKWIKRWIKLIKKWIKWIKWVQDKGILTDNALVPSGQSFPARAAVGMEPRAADVRAENQTQFGVFPSVSAPLDKSRLCRRAGKSSLWDNSLLFRILGGFGQNHWRKRNAA